MTLPPHPCFPAPRKAYKYPFGAPSSFSSLDLVLLICFALKLWDLEPRPIIKFIVGIFNLLGQNYLRAENGLLSMEIRLSRC